MIKKNLTDLPNSVEIGSCGPEIWSHEYIISPIEYTVNWADSSVMNQANLHCIQWELAIHAVISRSP